MASSNEADRKKKRCKLSLLCGKAMIDIIAAVQQNTKKNDFEFMRGHLINLLLFCLAQAVLRTQMILATAANTQKQCCSRRFVNLRNINLHDRQLCHSALQEIDFDCNLIFT
jgi:hypothetical protein